MIPSLSSTKIKLTKASFSPEQKKEKAKQIYNENKDKINYKRRQKYKLKRLSELTQRESSKRMYFLIEKQKQLAVEYIENGDFKAYKDSIETIFPTYLLSYQLYNYNRNSKL